MVILETINLNKVYGSRDKCNGIKKCKYKNQ